MKAERKEVIYIIYLIKRNKSDLKIRKKMLTWKIVEAAKASVLYIYIDKMISNLRIL